MCLFCKCPPHPFTPHHRLRWFFFLYISQLLYIYPKPLATTFCTFRALLHKSWEGKKRKQSQQILIDSDLREKSYIQHSQIAITLLQPSAFLFSKLNCLAQSQQHQLLITGHELFARFALIAFIHCLLSSLLLLLSASATVFVCLPACVFPPPLFATIYLHRPILVPLLSSFLAPARKPP